MTPQKKLKTTSRSHAITPPVHVPVAICLAKKAGDRCIAHHCTKSITLPVGLLGNEEAEQITINPALRPGRRRRVQSFETGGDYSSRRHGGAGMMIMNGDDPAARPRQPGCRRERERGKKSESPSGAGVFDCAARKAGRSGAGDPPAANIF